jgi:uncharacterized membrane protein YGL010W
LGPGPLLLGALLHLAGHYYEGRAPGLVQDLIDLLAAPLFVAAELLFSLGWLARCGRRSSARPARRACGT